MRKLCEYSQRILSRNRKIKRRNKEIKKRTFAKRKLKWSDETRHIQFEIWK